MRPIALTGPLVVWPGQRVCSTGDELRCVRLDAHGETGTQEVVDRGARWEGGCTLHGDELRCPVEDLRALRLAGVSRVEAAMSHACAIVKAGRVMCWGETDALGHRHHATNTEPVISHIERVSRPGCRVYVGRTDIPRVLGGLGINILTTPRGVMTGRSAHKENVGGELLCQIW